MGFFILRGREGTPVPPEVVAGVTPHSPAASDQKHGDRPVLTTYREKILAAEWWKKDQLFSEGIKGQEMSLDELCSIFHELNALPGEKFGVAGIALNLFSAYAKQDPAAGLGNLELLGAGVVRTKALRGFASDLPAEYVSQLIDSVKQHGFPDEEIRQIAQCLHSAARKYSPDDLKKIIDAGYFDESNQQDLTWMYEGMLRDRQNPNPQLSPEPAVAGSQASESEADSPAEPELNDAQETEAVPPAIAALNDAFAKDRFSAANALQGGMFGKEALSREVVKNVSRQLTSADPEAALTWAGNWHDTASRETAIDSVVWSWVRSDPEQCTAAINRMKDPKAKDIAAAEVVDYLISRGSSEEAAAWVDAISDPAKRAQAEESLSKSKR